MEQSKRNKSNRGWPLIIKTVVAVLAVWFIYREVVGKGNLAGLADVYRSILMNGGKLVLLITIFLLMILNWSIEALKWTRMISKIETVSFLKSLQAVFSGLTVSFFTPNRVGEYAGRVFHIETADRIKATLITVVENLSQLLVTMVAGSVSLIFYLKYFVIMNEYFFFGITVLIVLFIFSCLLIFLNVSFLNSFFTKFRFTKSWIQYTEVLGYYSYSELTGIILLAASRYLVFTTQYYLLLILFDVHVSYSMAILLISMIFYVMALVPTMALTEIGVRGAVAAFFFGHVTDQIFPVLNATVSLWFINLVIPALAGVVFVFKFHFVKKEIS